MTLRTDNSTALHRPHSILSRTYSLITELISTQDELVAAKKGSGSGSGSDSGSADLVKENAKLKSDLDNLKKQAKGQQTEYNRMGDELSAAQGQKASSKKD